MYTPFILQGLKLVFPAKSTFKKAVPTQPPQLSVESFLTRIGRGCSAWSGKFTDWQDLFQATGAEMRERGIPITIRKYILKWTWNYRLGKAPIEYPMNEKQAKKKRFPLAE